ncbi:putative caffeoylshikimate esterase [Cocos nucifera]|uniref:Putative caffeoylshikimate esterase n=1 Tax=Cocos nucifera TaxID=13894 RepID=A0A8K0IV96_COCNU|nr:putative caffeoylshikimate esterase [Cocos nucifera]
MPDLGAAKGATVRRALIPVAARKAIEGVGEELNSLAAQNMDFAPARRQLRAAFLDVQQRLDHFLFKIAPKEIQTDERYQASSKGVEVFWKRWLPSPGVSTKAALFFCHGYGDTCIAKKIAASGYAVYAMDYPGFGLSQGLHGYIPSFDGIVDHVIEQYAHLRGIAKKIAASGYAVYAMDYPGFGLSQGLHGYIPSFDGIVDHVIEQYAHLRAMKEARELPHFLLGQSMGGAVALKVHLKQPKEWDGVILVAPMCKIAADVTPPGPVLKALTLMSYVLPEAKLFPQKDLGNLAFRDPMKRKVAEFNVISYSDQMRLRTAVELIKATQDIESQLEKIAADVTPPGPVLKALTLMSYVLPEAKLFPQKDLGNLAFRDPMKRKVAEFNVISYSDQMRLRTAVELIKATQDIESQLEKVSSPLLILHGAADKVTDPNVSKFLYDKASTKDKTLKLYEGGYHSILEGEPDDRIESVINDIISWLDSHCAL